MSDLPGHPDRGYGSCMKDRRKFVKKPSAYVTAVRFDLDTDGFTYRKWGDTQRCKRGDWIVDNDGDVYSVDAQSFARTYRPIGKGAYVKTTPIWAEVATHAGDVPTKEGSSHYEPGDYLVSNEADGSDPYCVKPDKFQEMYEPAE
jgi:hypothetical protein